LNVVILARGISSAVRLTTTAAAYAQLLDILPRGA
jgi:hypothetical protein